MKTLAGPIGFLHTRRPRGGGGGYEMGTTPPPRRIVPDTVAYTPLHALHVDYTLFILIIKSRSACIQHSRVKYFYPDRLRRLRAVTHLAAAASPFLNVSCGAVSPLVRTGSVIWGARLVLAFATSATRCHCGRWLVPIRALGKAGMGHRHVLKGPSHLNALNRKYSADI